MKTFLISVSLLGLYTQLPLFVPFGLFLFPSLIGFVICGLRKNLLVWLLGLTWVLLALFFVAVIFRGGATEVGEQFRSLCLFVLTIAASFGFWSLITSLQREYLYRFLYIIIIIILSGLFLERIGLTKSLSDATRNAIYPAQIVYANDLRDIVNYGFVRPKFFASEPSHVAKFFGTLVGSAAVIAPNRSRVRNLLISLTAFLVLLPSISLLFGAITALLCVAFRTDDGSSVQRWIRISVFTALLLIIGMGAVQMSQRLGFAGNHVEGSAYERIIEPANLARASLAERPLFGFGIGVQNDLLPVLARVRSSTDVPLFFLQKGGQEVVAGNVIFSMFWQYGLIGTILLWTLIIRFSRHLLCYDYAFAIVFVILLGLNIADLHTPLLWGYFMFFVAALHLSAQTDPVVPGPPVDRRLSKGKDQFR